MLYAALFREKARRETREVTLSGHPDIPNDSYGFLEFYCPDPECDCQMVMLGVISKRLEQQVANFVYSFRPTDVRPDEPNPEMGIAAQAPYAPALLEWFTHLLQEDPAYERRLREHYRQVKEATTDPAHPAHAIYQTWLAELEAKNNNSGNEGKVSQRRRKQTSSVPKVMQARHDEIVALADAFCEVRLSEEYAALCHQMAATLARKRPSPLASGKTNMWACAILYALGQVNFLFDKSQKLNISADELCSAFGVSKSAASAKARQIREALDIYVLDPKWSLPSQMGENPMAWMITVDGFMVDARTASREVQKEAYRKGLIPYIPADKR